MRPPVPPRFGRLEDASARPHRIARQRRAALACDSSRSLWSTVVAGSGQIWVHAATSVSASVPGTGAVVYSGDPPHVSTNVSGTGTVVAK
jgi:hypothetical protein